MRGVEYLPLYYLEGGSETGVRGVGNLPPSPVEMLDFSRFLQYVLLHMIYLLLILLTYI